jgi:hypothetical protein
MPMREKCRPMMGRSLDLFHKSVRLSVRNFGSSTINAQYVVLTSCGPDRYGFPQTLRCLFTGLICLIAM